MPAKPRFDPRKLMELAVQVMHESVSEMRDDLKASPLVGAVLWRPDGVVERACRGELRQGDHAEYTLLERKNRASRLDGSVLFATLEPCAPGARAHPKLSCAERIVAARIKEVWVGIEDPDPAVDGKGIKYLRDHGVAVRMFDRDLQELIIEANSRFIEQAVERAIAAEDSGVEELIQLSPLEKALHETSLEDLAEEALEEYRRSAGVGEEVRSQQFTRRLIQQGLAERSGERIVPTGFGFMLFAREPRVAIPQAGLLATIHYPDGTQELRDFDGPMVLIPPEVEDWLSDKLPHVAERGAMRRTHVPPVPMEMVREAVVNALIHRDYEIREAKCQLVVEPDTITVKSPGLPPPPVTLDQLQAFEAPMLSRNPKLHYVFSRMGFAEERGLGVASLRARAQQAGLPLPSYRFDAPYLVLTLFRSVASSVDALDPEVRSQLSAPEREGLQWLTTQGKTRPSAYAEAMAVTPRTATRHLGHFVKLGLCRRIGAGPSTEYEAI